MSRALAPTRIAEIKLESGPAYVNDITGHREPFHFQPAGVRLDNDGSRYHWVVPQTTYTLHHDGVGWRVESSSGEGAGHILRLADAAGPKGSFVSALPLAEGGSIDLVLGTTYELALQSSPEATRSGLYLSTVD